ACLQLVLEPQGADKAHLFRGAGQVRLERVLALQHVEHRAAGLVRRVRLRFEGFCADKPGQLEHFVDVLFEPGIELVEDGPINTQGHFVDRPVGYHAIVRISHGLWMEDQSLAGAAFFFLVATLVFAPALDFAAVRTVRAAASAEWSSLVFPTRPISSAAKSSTAINAR